MPQIEQLQPGQAAANRLRAIRLRALKDAPDAFGSTLEDALTRSAEDWLHQTKVLLTFLAVVEERDAGMVRIGVDTENAQTMWLLSMWVEPVARGCGIGDALVEAAINAARRSGARLIKLDVADNNQPAAALYMRHGFAPNGVRGTLPTPRTHIKEHQLQRNL